MWLRDQMIPLHCQGQYSRQYLVTSCLWPHFFSHPIMGNVEKKSFKRWRDSHQTTADTAKSWKMLFVGTLRKWRLAFSCVIQPFLYEERVMTSVGLQRVDLTEREYKDPFTYCKTKQKWAIKHCRKQAGKYLCFIFSQYLFSMADLWNLISCSSANPYPLGSWHCSCWALALTSFVHTISTQLSSWHPSKLKQKHHLSIKHTSLLK